MPWVKFDDTFTDHRKIRRLSDAAFRLHVSAVFWCTKHLTDGHIRTEELGDVSDVRNPRKHVGQLVDRGLWDEDAAGWWIHDYLDYQPSRAKVLAERERRARSGQKGGVASGQTRRGGDGSVSNMADYR